MSRIFVLPRYVRSVERRHACLDEGGYKMKKNNTIEFKILEDRELIAMFDRVARKNGSTAEVVLSEFIRDYIVSGGHPENVGDRARI